MVPMVIAAAIGYYSLMLGLRAIFNYSKLQTTKREKSMLTMLVLNVHNFEKKIYSSLGDGEVAADGGGVRVGRPLWFRLLRWARMPP